LRCSGDGRQTNDGSADAGIAGPPSSQFSASVNANLVSRHQQCPGPWPCCCCCCCCSSLSLSLSTSSAQSTSVRSPTHPCRPKSPTLPCPALPTFFLVASILSSLVPSAYPALPSPSVQCSALARPILLPESHPISCSARRRQACVHPVPAPSACPACQFGDACLLAQSWWRC
jgi:hypothetical protein